MLAATTSSVVSMIGPNQVVVPGAGVVLYSQLVPNSWYDGELDHVEYPESTVMNRRPS